MYLLCKPDLPWEADALRENPDDRCGDGVHYTQRESQHILFDQQPDAPDTNYRAEGFQPIVNQKFEHMTLQHSTRSYRIEWIV